jgi:hypothetical protein
MSSLQALERIIILYIVRLALKRKTGINAGDAIVVQCGKREPDGTIRGGGQSLIDTDVSKSVLASAKREEKFGKAQS